MSKRFQQWALILAAAAIIFLGSRECRRLLAQAPPPPTPGGNSIQPAQPSGGNQAPVGSQTGPEVLTRGPIHEAFAEVVSYNPQPGQIVLKEPPKAIEEIPPTEKPVGDYAWIPGYWAWDQEHENFIWVTGAWRIPPPATTWIPGYWHQASNGYQWVGGYWGPAANATRTSAETVYLPTPPESVEAGASTAAPSPDHFWIPGYWYWADGRYVWRAGYWSRCQPDWVWIPARYVWTPGGYVFVDGHWDYALEKRGVVFCPVYFADAYHVDAAYCYTPSVCVETPVLTGYLFCRPTYGHYYFGDYYDPMYVRMGIYPWYAVQERRYGYEPLFVYDRWYYGRSDPGWELRLRGDYEYRVAHVDARPPHTYVAAMQIDVRTPGARVTLAAPIAHVAAASGGTMQFERMDAQRRAQFVNVQHEVQQVQIDRRNQEIKADAQARANGSGQPVRMNVHTSEMTTSRESISVAARTGADRTTTGSGAVAGHTEMAGSGALSGKTTGSGAAGSGQTVAPNGSAPRTGTATSRKAKTTGKGRDPRDRDKDQGNR